MNNVTLSNLSSRSTLTRVDSARKRKRDCDSVESTTLPLKMECVDHGELFKQLMYARFAQSPYEEFQEWNKEGLWSAILDVMYPHNLFRPSVKSIIDLVSQYDNYYTSDPSLMCVPESIKNNVRLVFGPLTDRGSLSIDGHTVTQDRGKPCTGIPLLNSCSSSAPTVGYASDKEGLRNIIVRAKERLQEKEMKRVRTVSSSSHKISSHKISRSVDSEMEKAERKKVADRIAELGNLGHLSCAQMSRAIDYFKQPGMRVDTFLKMTSETQFEYLKSLSPRGHSIRGHPIGQADIVDDQARKGRREF